MADDPVRSPRQPGKARALPGHVGIRALRQHLPEVISTVQQTGQAVPITHHGKRVATLVPASQDPALPQIIAFASLKGGAGKSTLSMHLAAAMSKDRSVVVLDADEETSVWKWKLMAEENGLRLPFDVQVASRNTLVRTARQLANQGHTVVIDTPPNNREILKTAALVANLVLVPVLPTGIDMDRLGTTIELLQEVEAAKPDFSWAVVLNRAEARRRLVREAKEALGEYPKLRNAVRSLAAYATVFGAVPTELAEFEALWEEIKSVFQADEVEA